MNFRSYVLALLAANGLFLAPLDAAEPATGGVPSKTVSRRQATLDEYERIKGSFPDTAEGQLAAAEWCRKNYLSAQRQQHLERVIEIDPENATGRRLLGYKKHEGEWVTQDQFMTDRGYVKHKGRWRLPQEIKQLEEKRKNTAAENQWVATLHKWRGWLNDERAQEAAANIEAINDPYALKALEEQLKVETSDPVRVLYLKAVDKIATPEAVQLMVRAALHDSSEEVRITAIEHLAEQKQPEVIAMFIQALRHKDNAIINRAALGLAAMDNPAAIPALIDVLVTEHRDTITVGSPGISSTFARPGGKNSAPVLGGLSTGQSTVEVVENLRNPQVLDALIKLTGVNYDFDVVQWKSWLANRKKGDSLDGRRG